MPQRIAIGRIFAVLALGAIIVAGAAGLLLVTGSHSAVTSTPRRPRRQPIPRPLKLNLVAQRHADRHPIFKHRFVAVSCRPASDRELPLGAQDVGNTTVTIPADTLLWSSWRLNSTEQIGGVEATVVIPASGVNSTIACAIYIDGKLAGSQTTRQVLSTASGVE